MCKIQLELVLQVHLEKSTEKRKTEEFQVFLSPNKTQKYQKPKQLVGFLYVFPTPKSINYLFMKFYKKISIISVYKLFLLIFQFI